MLRKIIIGLISLSLLIVLTAAIIPFCIDINRYKPEILAKAQEQLGRKVILEGDLTFRLLPNPALTLEKIKLANVKGGSQSSMASIEAVQIQIALLPLLRQKIHFTKIELIRPDVLLEVMPNGQGNWIFVPQTSEAKAVTLSEDNSKPTQSLDIEIHSLEISKGHLIYKQNDTTHEIKDLSTNISLGSLQGPFKGKGDFTYSDRKIDFDLKLGRYQEIQPLEATFSIGPVKASLTGQLLALQKIYQGELTLQAEGQALEKEYGLKIPNDFRSDFQLKAKTFASAQQIKLENIQIQAGEIKATGDIQADLQDKIQLKSNFKEMPGGLEIKLILAQEGINYQGKLEAQVQNLKDLMQTLHIDCHDIPDPLLKKLGIKSDLKITSTERQLSALVLDLAQTQITGKVTWFTKTPKSVLVLDLKTANSSPLWALAGFSSPSSPEIADLKGKIEENAQDLSYDLQGKIGETLFAVKGQAQDLTQKLNYSLKIDLKSPSFAIFVKKFDLNLPQSLTKIDFNASLKGTKEKINFELNSLCGDLTIRSKGMIDHLSQEPIFDLHFSATHPQLKKLLNILGNSDHAPLGNFSVEGQAIGNLQNLKFDHLKGNLGTAGNFTGLIHYSHPQNKPFLNADLQFSTLQLDSLLAFLKDSATVSPQSQILQVAYKPNISPVSRSRTMPWSQDKLDLNFLTYFDATFKISAPLIKKENLIFNDMTFMAEVQKGILRIDHLKAKLYGGDVLLSGSTDSKNNEYDYTFSTTGAELKNFSPKESAVKIVQGKMDLQGHLTSKGESIYDLVSHLKGDISLKAQDGVVSGFDLHRIISNLKNMNRLQGVLEGITQLLSMSFNKGQTAFSQLQATAKILEGKARLENVKLLIQGGEGSAQGVIDLPQYGLDVHTQFLITDIKGLPPIQVHFTGPLNQPQRSIDSRALQQHLLKNVVSSKGVIEALKSGKTKPADILGAFIGGNKESLESAQPAENTPTTPQDSTPKSNTPNTVENTKKPHEIVKGLLKGLF